MNEIEETRAIMHDLNMWLIEKTKKLIAAGVPIEIAMAIVCAAVVNLGEQIDNYMAEIGENDNG